MDSNYIKSAGFTDTHSESPEEPNTLGEEVKLSIPNRSVTTTTIGVGMIITSVIMMWNGYPFAFDVTALAWGSIITAMGQYFRHKEVLESIEVQKEALRIRYEENVGMQRQALLESVMVHGLPAGVNWQDVEEKLLALEEKQELKTSTRSKTK